MKSDFLQPTILVNNLTVRRNNQLIVSDISFQLDFNDQVAILGNAGSGKTSLGKALAKKIFFEGEVIFKPNPNPSIVFIEQQHSLKNKFNTTDLYYQQRFNSFDAEDTITVRDFLGDSITNNRILHDLDLGYLSDRPLIQLSNGENKKIQLAKYLSDDPDILVLDNPFLGLDVNTRAFLHHHLNTLSSKGKVCILITSPDEIPDYISKILELEAGRLTYFGHKEKYQYKSIPKRNFLSFKTLPLLTKTVNAYPEFEYAVKMKDVSVKYGENKILEGIHWDIKKGERWHLKGHNGAGKTTLLSLITGDNPQAYANDIHLFDKKRGTGETIWDIKSKIGLLSPEVHLFFDKSTTLFNTIGSGFFDSMGLFQRLNENQKILIREWLQYLGFDQVQDKYLYEVSLGQQRLALLARAFIKNPPLMILDEPCQGLDQVQKREILNLIDFAYLC
jgi:molybdate transport system ATP-binding protein